MQGSSLTRFRSFSGPGAARGDVARWWDAALAVRGIGLELWLACGAAFALIADMALWAVDDAFGSPVWLLFGVTVLMFALSLGLFVAARLRSLSLQVNHVTTAKAGRASSNGRGAGSWKALGVPYSAWLFYERLREEVQRSEVEGLSIGVIVARVGCRQGRDGATERGFDGRSFRPAHGSLRSVDVLGRLAPHEYALYMPETDRAGALSAGASLDGLFDNLAGVAVGVAAYPEDGASPVELVDAARGRALLPRGGGPTVSD